MAEARLRAVGVDSARLDAQVLAAHALGRERSWVLANPQHEVSERDMEALLSRRESREPLAYILGYREFYGRRFKVSPAVLIPRQETEILVDAAVELAPESGRVLDIGTGSGCIAISIALERPDLHMVAADVSEEALVVARENDKALGAKLDLVHSDLFANITGHFDLIVSNPPYISREESLMPEVALHEPDVALYSDEGGNEIYKRLALESAEYLRRDGRLAVELGYLQSETVPALFALFGWHLVELRRDYSGVERVAVFGRD